MARTASANLRALSDAVRPAEDFGTPIAQALRALTIEIRATRRQRLQETALRAPVTMLFPTAGFILLPIFAIVLGPIALRARCGSPAARSSSPRIDRTRPPPSPTQQVSR